MPGRLIARPLAGWAVSTRGRAVRDRVLGPPDPRAVRRLVRLDAGGDPRARRPRTAGARAARPASTRSGVFVARVRAAHRAGRAGRSGSSRPGCASSESTATGGPSTCCARCPRQVLIALVIPPLVFRPDGRGLHDIAAGSATVTLADAPAALLSGLIRDDHPRQEHHDRRCAARSPLAAGVVVACSPRLAACGDDDAPTAGDTTRRRAPSSRRRATPADEPTAAADAPASEVDADEFADRLPHGARAGHDHGHMTIVDGRRRSRLRAEGDVDYGDRPGQRALTIDDAGSSAAARSRCGCVDGVVYVQAADARAASSSRSTSTDPDSPLGGIDRRATTGPGALARRRSTTASSRSTYVGEEDVDGEPTRPLRARASTRPSSSSGCRRRPGWPSCRTPSPYDIWLDDGRPAPRDGDGPGPQRQARCDLTSPTGASRSTIEAPPADAGRRTMPGLPH